MIFPPQVTLVSDDTPVGLLASLKESLANKAADQIKSAFVSPTGSAYVLAMAANRGGLQKVKISMIPAPPGWPGKYWAVFHTVQTIEEDHDPVYQVDRDSKGAWKLLAEVPEDYLGGWRVASETYQAQVEPEGSRVSVHVQVRLKRGAKVAVLFRLNENYRLNGRVVVAGDSEIPKPQTGDLVRAGSLLIPWQTNLGDSLDLSYSATLPKSSEDEVTAKDAYVTAWWLPSLGRLPFPVDATITAPAEWKVRAEGNETSSRRQGALRTTKFECPLPISYPKITAGRYTKMASGEQDGDKFAIFQVDPTDQKRADRDLKAMMAAAAFYRPRLGRLPFHGYECYDADRFYGIESYSHTVLQKNVTHFISHEMGHTYFGGLAPCPYVNDSWNEGVTEYVDSVLFLNNLDRSLENGLKTVDIPVPLSKMPIPWNLGDATYWRGCYVMKMLEAEIGAPQVLKALKAIASERVGKDTRWADLRPYFEHAGGKPLGWFWAQWIDGGTFPTLHFTSSSTEIEPGKWENVVTIDQGAVGEPFRLRLGVKYAGVKTSWSQPVLLTDWNKTIRYTTPEKPNHIELTVFPYTLVHLKRSAGE